MSGFDRGPIDSVRILLPEAPGNDWIMENGDGILRTFPGSMSVPLTEEELGLAPPPG